MTILSLSDWLNFSVASNKKGSDIKKRLKSIFWCFQIPSGEDEEEVLLVLRAKLFRYDHSTEPKEWKERGTGDTHWIYVRRFVKEASLR